MEIKITLNREEVAEMAQREYTRRFGDLPKDHSLSATQNYGELVIEVFPTPKPVEPAPGQILDGDRSENPLPPSRP